MQATAPAAAGSYQALSLTVVVRFSSALSLSAKATPSVCPAGRITCVMLLAIESEEVIRQAVGLLLTQSKVLNKHPGRWQLGRAVVTRFSGCGSFVKELSGFA